MHRHQGTEIPDNLLPPVLHLGLELYFTAFQDLSTTRPLGVSPGPISWLVIEEYADRLGFDMAVRQELHHHVRQMDNAFLAHMSKQTKAKSKGRSGNEDPGGRSPKGSPAKQPSRRGRG